MRHSRLCGGWPRTTAGASSRLIRTLAGRRRLSLTRPPPSLATARKGQGVFHVVVISEQVPAHPRVQTLRRLLGEPDPGGFGPGAGGPTWGGGRLRPPGTRPPRAPGDPPADRPGRTAAGRPDPPRGTRSRSRGARRG